MKAIIEHFKINRGTPDRLKMPPSFWAALKTQGVSLGLLMKQTGLPAGVFTGEVKMSTTQSFALWRGIQALSPDASLGWRLTSQRDSSQFAPTLLAALDARNLRESLQRFARYKQLCSAQEFRFVQSGDDFRIETAWPFAAEEAPPPLLVDAMFAVIMELARRGTQCRLTAKRLELARKAVSGDGLADYFGCPIQYACARNALVLRSADLERPFVTHNDELFKLLAPQFEDRLKATSTTPDTPAQVKWVLRRLLSGSRPDLGMVARELGMSERTLQRRITEEGTTFRDLLHATRKELVLEYLENQSMQIAEVAFLVGFENTNSFYRAFRSWEGRTPAEWRAEREHRG